MRRSVQIISLSITVVSRKANLGVQAADCPLACAHSIGAEQTDR
jgi:hypothetical protein